LTGYHSKYFAYELTKKYSSDKLEKLSQSIFNAYVDLNPHQLEAALFAFRSPLSRGAILADEVGLGKTIEAALIVSQLWAERKRRILCITPASLRKQWNREFIEKFYINSIILETKSYNQFIKHDNPYPFEQNNKIVICSYHFAKSKSEDIIKVPWDLVVIDEAHRLRNVYRKDNKIARAIRNAIGSRPKILLTATPLQNSLMELYGLISFIDPHIFGDQKSFRAQFTTRAADATSDDFIRLKNRIKPICQRTLRRQIRGYIKYTNRQPITQDFTPTDDEQSLYEKVSAYLQRSKSFALPRGQRNLITLVMRKILASSSFAITDTLSKLISRLERIKKNIKEDAKQKDIELELDDFEAIETMQDEWAEDVNADADYSLENDNSDEKELIKADIISITNEIAELSDYRKLARTITENEKGNKLLIALKTGFKKLHEIGAEEKALIFTESRRTQRYLKELLYKNGYNGKVILFNGTNNEPESKAIYKTWIERHSNDDIITGSKSADMKSALVEEFKDRATIMIATESGAEGINLQFCSLVVNYDLPWNPQRIEQRIGRCHRYGQKHDVVVINFLNRRNEADKRVFELLSNKLHLFEGIFGASDEILGAIDAGIDFEKRIYTIYQTCRTSEEINSAFDQLQTDLDGQIQIKFMETRQNLLENFDEEVHRKLRTAKIDTETQVNKFEEWLWHLTKYELQDYAEFNDNNYTFNLIKPPAGNLENISLGKYKIITQDKEEGLHHYRLGHPLAKSVIKKAKSRKLPPRKVIFDYTAHRNAGNPKISVIEQLVRHSGWLKVVLLNIEALENEEYILMAGIDDNGSIVDAEICSKMFNIEGRIENNKTIHNDKEKELNEELVSQKKIIIDKITNRDGEYFDSEMEKLENWAQDNKKSLKETLKEFDNKIKETKKEIRIARNLPEKLELQKQLRDINLKRNTAWKNYDKACLEIEKKQDILIDEIEARLKQNSAQQELFVIKWMIT